MKKVVYNLFLLLLISACSSSKKEPVKIVEEKPKAEWMVNPPIDPNYYVGIGMVNKTIEKVDYPTTAKKRALDDLASSIKVKISSSSVLHQMDQSSGYNETYSSLIKSSSDLDIEGYELVDIWENENEYWSYYRLEKSVYQNLQKEKKKRVSEKALNLYTLANQYQKSKKIDLALKNYLEGLFVLKEYLGEQVIIDINGTNKDINSTIYQDLQNCLSNITLNSIKDLIHHKLSSDMSLSIPLSVEYDNSSVSNLYIETTYLADDQFGNTSKKSSLIKSSVDGICKFTYHNIAKKTKSQSIKYKLSLWKIAVSEQNSKLKEAIYSGLIVPEKLIDIQLIMPKVYLDLKEQNIGKTMNSSGVGSHIANGLIKKGIDVIETKSKADFIIEVSSNTSPSNESNGVYSASLKTTVYVRNQQNEIVYQKSLSGINGSQLTYEKAGFEAYKNAETEIKYKLLKELLKELL